MKWWMQWAFDGAFLAFVILWLYEKRKAARFPMSKEALEFLAAMEKKVRELEQGAEVARVKLEAKLRDLQRICEQASGILNQSTAAIKPLATSKEELELSAALANVPSVENIPTLAELQKTRERLKPEAALDLKTLLQGQLA